MIPGGVIPAMMRAAATGGGSIYTYTIDRSLRFNDGDSAYCSFTPGGAGTSDKIMTLSLWAKRCNLGALQDLFSAAQGANTDTLFFGSSDKLEFYFNDTASGHLVSTSAFRDVTAWYHIVAEIDTTQATAANRVKLYVNGDQITAFDTASYPAQNYSMGWAAAVGHTLGRYNNSGLYYFDGYMAEVYFIDGTAHDASAFGETDTTTGTWKPKAPSGLSYGTNGFYLSFADNTSTTTLGYDDAGSNDWTLNNFSVTAGAGNDSLTDTPTDNHCVWNAISGLTGGTLSNGNLDSSGSAIGTIDALASGGYWEITANAASVVGGAKNEAGTEHTISIASGKTYGFRLSDAGALDYINITDVGSWTSITTGLSGSWFPYAEGGANTLNCGQRPYAGTKPAGYNTLSTANLPTPTIQDPTDYFNAVGYTGDGTAIGSGGLAVTGVGHQPDLVWIKNRDAADQHVLTDSVRGVTKYLSSDGTDVEATAAETLDSFDTDGFTVGSDVQVNTNTEDYIAWCWKEGATPGFDIVSYTGNGSGGNTVAHALGVAPEMMIIKNRDQADGWAVYHKDNTSAPETDYLVLDTTAATADDSTLWNDTAPTDSVITLGTSHQVNANTEDYIAYLWASVEGFSKVGVYTGNGSADGPFVYCGFRPRWVVIKRLDGAASWYVHDTARSPGNVADGRLYLDLSSAEGTGGSFGVDFLAPGFKVRTSDVGWNASGGTYIFAAFAEMPLNYANAR